MLVGASRKDLATQHRPRSTYIELVEMKPTLSQPSSPPPFDTSKVAAVADEESLCENEKWKVPPAPSSTKMDTKASVDERSGKNDGGMDDDDDKTERLFLSFPSFTSKEDSSQYLRFARRYVNILYVIPGILATNMPVATRFNLGLLGGGSPILVTAFFIFFSAYALFAVSMTPQISRLFPPLRAWGRRVGASLEKYPFGDMACLGGVIGAGLFTVFRVVNGQCPAGTTVWQSQACNPFAASGSIPVDDAIFLFACPIGFQVVLRPSSGTLVMMWLAAVTVLLFNVCYIDAWANGWVLGYAPFFMNVSSEYERLSRLTFVLTKKAHEQRVHEVQSAATLLRAREQQLEAEAQQSRLQAETMSQKHALEAVQRERSNEALLAQKEQEQLRAIIGNVAHDLKTPLFSISAEIDTLQVPPIYPYLGPYLSLSTPLTIPI